MEIAGLRVEDVLEGYEACAYWSSNSGTDDRGGEPLDNYMAAHDTVSSETCAARMREDVERFLRECARENLDLSACDAGQVGHDAWLTRNRHGVGFWARDEKMYGSILVRNRLNAIAMRMGTVDLWVDTDKNTVEHD